MRIPICKGGRGLGSSHKLQTKMSHPFSQKLSVPNLTGFVTLHIYIKRIYIYIRSNVRKRSYICMHIICKYHDINTTKSFSHVLKWSKQLRETMGKLRDTPPGERSSRVTIANHCESLRICWKISEKNGFSKIHLALAEETKVWYSVIRFERSFGFQAEKVLRGRPSSHHLRSLPCHRKKWVAWGWDLNELVA